MWLGLGLAGALAGLSQPAFRRPARLAVAGGLLISLAYSAASRLPSRDASRDAAAETFAQAVMQQTPPGALIFTHADQDAFATWYMQFSLRQRPDAAVVVEPLLPFQWYRANVAAGGTGLVIPAEPAPTWRQAVIAANTRPVCDTQPDSGLPALTCQPPR